MPTLEIILSKGIKMKFKASLIFIFFLSLFFTACDFKSKKATEEKDSKEKFSQIEFNLDTLDNKMISLKQEDEKIFLDGAENKLVLLNFFTTWCPACKVEIENLVKLQASFPNDLVVIGILLEDFKSNEEIEKFLIKHKINYIVTNSVVAFDLAKSLGGLKAVPTLFLIDKEGNIFQKYTGLVPNEMMEIDIKKLLEK